MEKWKRNSCLEEFALHLWRHLWKWGAVGYMQMTPKTMDLEVEDELLAQDPPFRQHKYERGNYREEIMGCYFHSPHLEAYVHNIFSPCNFPHVMKTNHIRQKLVG